MSQEIPLDQARFYYRTPRPTMDIACVPFARKVLEHARAHPDNFDMTYWVLNPGKFGDDDDQVVDLTQTTPCGTTACLAGTAVLLDPNPNLYKLDGCEELVCFKDGSREGLVEYAAGLLGLDLGVARHLFEMTYDDEDALKSLEDLIAKAEQADV